MADTTTAEVYERAGFGRPLELGTRPAVVVVDFIYGFTDPGYPTGADMSGPVSATARLLETARRLALPVIFTAIAYDQDEISQLTWLRKATGMAALELGSRLVDVDERLSPRIDEHLVVKTGASAFFGTSLASYLASARVNTVVITGATTSGCVRASVVDAVQHGYPTLVPSDCVADRARAPHEASLFDMNEKYADVVDLDHVLRYFAALSDPTTPSPAEAPA